MKDPPKDYINDPKSQNDMVELLGKSPFLEKTIYEQPKSQGPGMTCSTQSCLFRCPNGQVLAPGGVWFYDMIQDIVTLSDITAMHIGQPQANITVSDLEKAVNYGLSDQRWTEELLKCVEKDTLHPLCGMSDSILPLKKNKFSKCGFIMPCTEKNITCRNSGCKYSIGTEKDSILRLQVYHNSILRGSIQDGTILQYYNLTSKVELTNKLHITLKMDDFAHKPARILIGFEVFKKSNPRPFLSEWDHFHCWERNPTFSEGSRPEVDNIKLSKIDSEPFLPSTGICRYGVVLAVFILGWILITFLLIFYKWRARGSPHSLNKVKESKPVRSFTFLHVGTPTQELCNDIRKGEKLRDLHVPDNATKKQKKC